MILFILFFIFILIKFLILTPVDTLNLAVGCSPSYADTTESNKNHALTLLSITALVSFRNV